MSGIPSFEGVGGHLARSYANPRQKLVEVNRAGVMTLSHDYSRSVPENMPTFMLKPGRHELGFILNWQPMPGQLKRIIEDSGIEVNVCNPKRATISRELNESQYHNQPYVYFAIESNQFNKAFSIAEESCLKVNGFADLILRESKNNYNLVQNYHSSGGSRGYISFAPFNP